MNKKFTYPLLALLLLTGSLFIYWRYQKTPSGPATDAYRLLERPGASGRSEEWVLVQRNAAALDSALVANPEDIKSRLALAALFIQEARITGNHEYYDAAAQYQTEKVLSQDPQNFLGIVFQSIIALSRHHFPEALQLAERARALNPNNAFVYGLLIDGQVEMGQYAKAVESSDLMVGIRPDTRSYSRISYLREIHGDYEGAIEAMAMAVEAGPVGEETTEWCRVQLGELLLKRGRPDEAQVQFDLALQTRPGFPFALSSSARCAAAKEDVKKAESLLRQAMMTSEEAAYGEALADLLLATGREKEGKKILQTLIAKTEAAMAEGETAAGHHGNMELATWHLLSGDYAKGLKHAEAEWRGRPQNIDALQLLAWAQYKSGDARAATATIQKAFATGSNDPQLLARAALIYAGAGQPGESRKMMSQAAPGILSLPLTLQAELRRQPTH